MSEGKGEWNLVDIGGGLRGRGTSGGGGSTQELLSRMTRVGKLLQEALNTSEISKDCPQRQ